MKVISGGQTGIDQLGLRVASELGIQTGGTAPKGFRTEIGPDPSLRKYGLVEDGTPNYTSRTSKNIVDADATVIFGDINSPGSRVTIRACFNLGKPYLCNPTMPQFVAWLCQHQVQVLNVAGNRASKLNERLLIMYAEILSSTLREYMIISSRP